MTLKCLVYYLQFLRLDILSCTHADRWHDNKNEVQSTYPNRSTMADHLVTFSRPCWRLPKRGCSVKFTGKVHLGVSVAKPLTILCGRRWKKLCQLESGMREGDNNTQFENRRGVVRLRGGGGARKGGKKEHRRRELFLRYIGIYRIYSRISIVTDLTCLVTILQLYILLYKAIRYSPLRAQGNDRK